MTLKLLFACDDVLRFKQSLIASVCYQAQNNNVRQFYISKTQLKSV